jgi:hypothetical protein
MKSKAVCVAAILAAVSFGAAAAEKGEAKKPIRMTDSQMAVTVAGKASDGVAYQLYNTKSGDYSYTDLSGTSGNKNKYNTGIVGWSPGTN